MTMPQLANCLEFQALAFDFDGTLVDTLHLHYEAYRRVFEEMNLELTPNEFYSNIGGKAAEAIPLFLAGREAPWSVAEIHARKKEWVKRMFESEPLHLLPTSGLLPLFVGRIPLALVSSGSRPGILQILQRLGWARFFDAIVTGEDTTCSKPDPAPYLLASRLLGVVPSRMAAFEDTAAGLASARNAGFVVFDVSPNSLALPQ